MATTPPQQPPASPRRLRENEEFMERLNLALKDRVVELRESLGEDPDETVGFFCECSDIDCRERVRTTPSRYQQIHRDPDLFIVVPGHELLEVETVVDQEFGYLIVRKLI